MSKKTKKEGKQEMRKQKSWNQGGKNRKQKLSVGEERLEHLLDQAEEEELMKISAIHSEVSMPLPNREKLAWSVIDKADLADEEELKRRREFQRMLRRKKMARIAIGCSAVVVLLLVLAWFGVFDYFRPPVYEDYYVLGGNCCSEADSIEPMEVFQKEAIPDGIEMSVPSLASGPQLDMDRLDTTAYDVLAKYCAANDYAVHEYKIVDYVSDSDEFLELGEETNPEYRMIGGKLYVRCTVIGTCLDYGMHDDGTLWGELTENGEWGWEHPATPFEFVASERSDIGEVIPILTSPLSLDDPANTCYVCLTLYVCIQD